MGNFEPLNILFLDSWFADRVRGSGSAVAITGLASGLRALGHRVTILRPRLALGLSDLTRISANIGYRFRVRRFDPDLIVGFDFDGLWIDQPGARYVVSLKGVMADELEYESGWNRVRFHLLSRLERRNARRADRVVLTSQHSCRIATQRYGLDPACTRIVPEGINVAAWSEPIAGDHRAGMPPTILSVGRQYRRKNTESLLRSMAAVRAQVPNARLRVVGGGPEVGRLTRLARSLGIQDTVTFVGSVDGVDGVRDEMSRADVFCLPSRQEGFGIVFLEAMAAGLPIVAADCAAVPETAPHGEVALLVDPDDVQGLAAAIVRLLKEPDLRTRFIAAGALRWRRYDWVAIAGQFLAAVGSG